MITMRYAVLALIASAVAACSNDTTAPQMATSSAPAFAKGVSSPNTPVNSSFVVYVGGSTYYAGSGPSRNGKGECRTHSDGTVGWYWVPGNITPDAPPPWPWPPAVMLPGTQYQPTVPSLCVRHSPLPLREGPLPA